LRTSHIEVRIDATNVMNHAQFQLGPSNTGSAAFGRVGLALAARRVQFLARYAF
jgi:hypothetical protein